MKEMNWLGMAHQYCIDNPMIVVIFILGWLVVAVGYLLFVRINDSIRSIKAQQGQVDADETFRWFSYVFYSCALTRITSIITMFYGVYWLEAIFIIINALVIVKTLFVYMSQKELFTSISFSQEEMDESVVTTKKSLLDEILEMDLSKETKFKIKAINKK